MNLNFSFPILLWAFQCYFYYSVMAAIDNSTDYSKSVTAIRTKIFKNYDPMAFPVINYTRPIAVRMHIRLLNFVLDTEQDLVDLHCFFRIYWSDPNLKWNQSEYGGVKRINARMDDVFTPDIILYNSIQPTNMMKHFNKSDLVIAFDGTVYWSPVLRMQSICKVDLYHWPYDRQNCSLIFISWSYPNDALALYISSKSLYLHDLWPNNEWRIISSTCDTLIVSEIPGRPDMFFPGIQYTVLLERRTTSYPYLISMPIISTIIVNIISLLCLSIDNHHTQIIRLHLNILSFFTLIFISFYSSYVLSLGKFATTKLVKLIASLLTTTAISMLWSTFAVNMLNSTESNSTRIARIVWQNITEPAIRWRLIPSNHQINMDENDDHDHHQNDRSKNYLFTILIDRILLIALLAIIIIFWLF